MLKRLVLVLAFSAPVFAQSLDVSSILERTNRERAARGLQPLRLNSTLTLAADDRVRDMLAKHYFAHVSPDGIRTFAWADKRGYLYRRIAENLALGFPTATEVVDGWMHSAGHRRNILTSEFEEIGIAVEDRLVVALYGLRRDATIARVDERVGAVGEQP